MYTTFHLSSAQELNSDILDAIKATFKSKSITITVEEDNVDFEITPDVTEMLDERLMEEKNTYLPSKESIKQLKSKYGI